MSRPIVAIVGRPNVGKSALFNKLIGKRISIVDDKAGVTRDRVYGICEWQDQNFFIVDTGGLDFCENKLSVEIQKQTEFALESSDVIVFVVDAKSGLVMIDEKISYMLKKSLKPIILCVNKCDNIGNNELNFCEFYSLGFENMIAVSSLHGHGTGDLLDVVCKNFPQDTRKNVEKLDIVNVALIGKPNVGKSTLLNKIVGSERSIVSSVAGTTRDAVDTEVFNEFGNFNFIDTAGIRRQSRISDSIEKFSVIRTNFAIERSDICVIMLDVNEEISEQDVRVAGFAHEAGKGCIICVNKCDEIKKNSHSVEDFKNQIFEKFGFMTYAPVLFISALTGKNLKKLFELILQVFNFSNMRVPTGKLNELLAKSMMRVPPPSRRGKSLKIYFITQTSVKPPTFVLFVNKKELFHFSYSRYLENCIRKNFDFTGVDIRFIIREKRGKFVDD